MWNDHSAFDDTVKSYSVTWRDVVGGWEANAFQHFHSRRKVQESLTVPFSTFSLTLDIHWICARALEKDALQSDEKIIISTYTSQIRATTCGSNGAVSRQLVSALARNIHGKGVSSHTMHCGTCCNCGIAAVKAVKADD